MSEHPPEPPVVLKLTGGRRNEEDSLHKAVTQFLSWSLPIDACWVPIPNGGWRFKSEGERMKGQGMVRAGCPDLLIVFEGTAIFIELKTDVGRLSPTQKQFMLKLENAGASVFVCRTVPEVAERLLEVGIRLRGRPT